MNNVIRPHDGKKFALTEKGKEVSRIAIKYAEDYKHQDYTKIAPESWLINEYIEEVDL